MSDNSFGARSTLTVGETSYVVYRLDTLAGTARLPYSLKVLLENLLRHEGRAPGHHRPDRGPGRVETAGGQ